MRTDWHQPARLMKQISEALNQATPGPWTVGTMTADHTAYVIGTPNGPFRVEHDTLNTYDHSGTAVLIAGAPGLLKEAVDTIARLVEERQGWRDAAAVLAEEKADRLLAEAARSKVLHREIVDGQSVWSYVDRMDLWPDSEPL